MMNLTARTPSFVSSSASSNLGRTSYGHQDPERHVLDDRTVQPVQMSRSDYLQKDYGLSWSSQEWKSGDGEHDRSGQPDRNFWDSLRKVDPHREDYLLDRTAHSARNEETIHDRTGKPVSENLQGKADFENFIMGSEITEFVNKVRNQVRIRQKNVKHCRELYRTFNNMENVYGYDIEFSDISGKEFFDHAECCEESRKSYVETDV